MPAPKELPLFPLGVVLFPGMPLPLRIFEERYKLMINTCLQGDGTFGVVLIRSGQEVGGPSDPFSIGTIARIIDVVRYPDGRMRLATVGQQPFVVKDIVQFLPYLIGKIEPVEHSAGDQARAGALAEQVKQAFRDHLGLLSKLAQQEIPEPPLESEPVVLSYAVATMAQLPMGEKQSLLEMPRADERLEKMLVMLARENRILQGLLDRRQAQERGEGGPPSLGGRFSSN